MKIQFEISDMLYRKFQAATVIREEDPNEVVVRMMSDYLQQLFPGVEEKGTVDLAVTASVPKKVDPFLRKKQFVEWFRAQEYHGRPYNPVTVSGYTGRIEKACQAPDFHAVPVKNLFEIDDVQTFRSVRELIEACDGFKRLDEATHNGFTAALNMYDRYLCMEADIPEESYKYMKRQPNIHRWTYEEDELCCRRYFETFVEKRLNTDLTAFARALSRELPDISVGSLQMKTQNIKQLCIQTHIPDTLSAKPLNQYSAQCERAFRVVFGL